ncbi:AHH domain-containing protein [Myxococcus sp. SDU36]|uniref:AHH domain-containing protein n=1 Tax=Myxococcus sp. SDU36 TaxID=2831967 RepID=UPI0025439E16|nr:AHH domain-containing protein [Myxococcus sp. SDU36]WIG93266.1 AHH domain-containing protein [Myxococcus sp. SDU36]
MAEADHLSGMGKLKARLRRSRDYREKGHKHIKGNGGRNKIYANLEIIQEVLQARGTRVRGDKRIKPGSLAHARRYTFVHGQNFKLGQSPYINQAHHLLPEEAFSDKYFDSDQMRMLLGVDYDINNGENIIFLPALARDSEFHRLPHHSGSHPAYSAVVSDDMSTVRDLLKTALEKDKKHKEWNPPEDVKTQLMDLQLDYWDMVSAAGPININLFTKPAPKKRAFAK